MKYGATMTVNKIRERLKLIFQKNYMDSAIGIGVVKQTLPDKVTSKNQRYYKV